MAPSHRFAPLFVAVAFASAASHVRADDVVRLEAIEAAATSTSRSIEARTATADAVRTHIRGTRADMLPQVRLDVGLTGAPGLQVVQVPASSTAAPGDVVYVAGTRALQNLGQFQTLYRMAMSLSANWAIYDFGRTTARIDAAQADADAYDADVRAEREDVIRRVRTAYLRWLGAYETRLLAESALAIATTRANQIVEASGLGARPGADRDAAAYEVARANLALARMRADEDDARIELAALARMTLAADATPDHAWVEPSAAEAPLPLPATIAAIELRREAIGASLRAYRRRYNPALAAGLQLGLVAQNTPSGIQAFPGYSFQVGFSMPIWDAHLGRQVRDEAMARDEALEATEEQIRSAFELERDRARLAAERANAQLGYADEMVRLATTLASNAEERYRTAGGSLDTVLLARQREQAAREERLRTALGLASARMRLTPIE